jgi:hypothetical protein
VLRIESQYDNVKLCPHRKIHRCMPTYAYAHRYEYSSASDAASSGENETDRRQGHAIHVLCVQREKVLVPIIGRHTDP